MRTTREQEEKRKIHVQLMNQMELMVGNRCAEELFHKSKKARMLTAYLILNRGEAVSYSELGRVLWRKNSIQNEANAIKVLVCRVRAGLTEIDPLLYDCFQTQNGSYAWNMEITTSVDVFEIERLCQELLEEEMTQDGRYKKLITMLGMYTGRLLPSLDREDWIEEYAERLRSQVRDAAEYILRKMSADEEWDRIVKVCGMCIEAMPYDSSWREYRMSALMMLDRRNDAMQQYIESVKEKHETAWGKGVPGVVELYSQMTQSDPTLSQGMDIVSKDLLDYEDSGGALFCEYVIFKHVYLLQQRSLERLAQNSYLSIIRMGGEAGRNIPVLAMEEAMQRLGRVLQGGLRRGDTIARYTPTQYVVLLQGSAHEAVRSVLDRMRITFYEEMKNISIRIDYDYRSLVPESDRAVAQAGGLGKNNGYAVRILEGSGSANFLHDRLDS